MQDSPSFIEEEQCYYSVIEHYTGVSQDKEQEFHQQSFREVPQNQSSQQNQKYPQSQLYYRQNYDSDYKKKLSKLQNFLQDTSNKKHKSPTPSNKKTKQKHNAHKVNQFTCQQDQDNQNSNTKQNSTKLNQSIKNFLQNHFSSIKIMIKPNKLLSLLFEGLLTFYAGTEKFIQKLQKQRMTWSEIQKVISNSQFPSVLQNYAKYIDLGLITLENVNAAKIIQEQILQLGSKSQIVLQEILTELINYYDKQHQEIEISQEITPVQETLQVNLQENLSPALPEKNSVKSFGSQEKDSERNLNEFSNIQDFKQFKTEAVDIAESFKDINITKDPLRQSKKNNSKSPTIQRVKTDSCQNKFTPIKGGKENRGKKVQEPQKLNVQQEKTKLNKSIELHRKKISNLQNQESMIKWQIEREVKQLAELEEKHKMRNELEWNSQQHQIEKVLEKEKQDLNKRNSKKDNAFKQDLRMSQKSSEKVSHVDYIMEQIKDVSIDNKLKRGIDQTKRKSVTIRYKSPKKVL